MAYKILTKNGINNTNIDGARDCYFNTGMRDGIVKGTLNEGTFSSNASNSVYLDTCELRIAGHRILIDEAVYQTFSNKPSSDKRYSFIAQVIVDDSSNVSFSIIIQDANTNLIKNNLYANQNGAGTYQVEIGRFTQLTDGTITDVIRTIDVITGGSGANGDYIVIGEVTTTMLDSGIDAEVDIENVTDENGNKKTNFNFAIPKTAGSIVNINGNQVSEVNFSGDPQTQIDTNINSIDNIINNSTKIRNSYGGSSTGLNSSSTYGGSSGSGATTTVGFSGGMFSSSQAGGAVGRGATSGDGFSGGYDAKTVGTSGNVINAIQLGTGTNTQEKTMQVYGDNIYDANTHTLKSQNISVNNVNVASQNDIANIKNQIWDLIYDDVLTSANVSAVKIHNFLDFANYDYKIEYMYLGVKTFASLQNKLSFINTSGDIVNVPVNTWCRFSTDNNFAFSGGTVEGVITPSGYGASHQNRQVIDYGVDGNDGSGAVFFTGEYVPSFDEYGNYNIQYKTESSRNSNWCQQKFMYSGCVVFDGTNDLDISGIYISEASDSLIKNTNNYIKIYRRLGGWNKFN